MKIKNKETWIILIVAIFLISSFAYTVRGATRLTGIIIFRDIPLTKENYKYFGTETISTSFYLPDDDCTGFVNYCSYVYVSEDISKADINKDGKIDDTDVAIISKAYGCKNGETCWNDPVEECFFTISGRKFKDPTRDCKMDSNDINLITNHYGETNDYALSPTCDNYEVCKADINQDGKVDVYDSTIANSKNGKTADLFERLSQHKSEADLDNDGDVDIYDAVKVTSNYGKEAIERRCSKESIGHIGGREYNINVSGIGISWVQVSYECSI
ncbi:MAG: hypothetical protein ACTSWZ_02970 [Candidatus Heimdallarchaeaceae archaeon]